MSNAEIIIEQNIDADTLKARAVYSWPIWEKEVSTFPWTYDANKACYFLEGDVIVTPEGGDPVRMGKGDFVRFPAGMSCVWAIRSAVKKHYYFDF